MLTAGVREGVRVSMDGVEQPDNSVTLVDDGIEHHVDVAVRTPGREPASPGATA